MVYYHLKIYHRLSNKLTKIFGEIPVHTPFFDLNEEELKAIKYAKEEDQSFYIKQTQFEPKKVEYIIFSVEMSKKLTLLMFYLVYQLIIKTD